MVSLFIFKCNLPILSIVVTVGFDQRDYTVSEAIQLLPVCVTVRNGTRLGTDLILHVESRARTAEGLYDKMCLCVLE